MPITENPEARSRCNFMRLVSSWVRVLWPRIKKIQTRPSSSTAKLESPPRILPTCLHASIHREARPGVREGGSCSRFAGGNRDIKFLGDPGRAWSIRIAPTEATLPSKGNRNFNTWFSQNRVASTRCLPFLPDSRIPVASFPPYASGWHVLDPT